MRQRTEFADWIASRIFVWLSVAACLATAWFWAHPNYWTLGFILWVVVHSLIALRLQRRHQVTARRVVVWWIGSSALALMLTLMSPIPITSLSMDVLSTRYSSEVTLNDRRAQDWIGTTQVRTTHGMIDSDSISRLTDGHGKVHFMLNEDLGVQDHKFELRFGRRSTAIYINDLTVGTDLAGLPIRLARWRGQAFLDAPFLTLVKTELTLGADGHLKMVGRVDRPVFQLDLSRGTVLANTPDGRVTLVRVAWLILFLGALPLILLCVTSSKRLPRFGMRLLRWLEAP